MTEERSYNRRQLWLAVSVLGVLGLVVLWLKWPMPSTAVQSSLAQAIEADAASSVPSDQSPTAVYAHNVMLRKGSLFRVYISWVRGEMMPTRPGAHPSFDDPSSFIFVIDKGVIHANLGDIGNYLNSAVPAKFPLKGIVITGDNDQVKISGTLHKLFVPLPIEILATVSSTSDGRIHLHVTKINVLKISVKALLRGLNVKIDDVVGSTPLNGVQIANNDIYFDTPKLLPPPYIRGHLTSVALVRPDLVLVYGDTRVDEARLSQWHNFLKLTGGTVDFAKLTMHNTDLILVDASDDAWFDLDLVNYKAQLVHGYSRLTPQAGLEMFMPDLGKKGENKSGHSVTLDWLRNRDQALPPDIPIKK